MSGIYCVDYNDRLIYLEIEVKVTYIFIKFLFRLVMQKTFIFVLGTKIAYIV